MSDEMAMMPRYQSHKKVWALKIVEIMTGRSDEKPGGTLHFEDPHYAPLAVDEDYLQRHQPKVGGYYIVYDDGYKSFSPAKAFEDGYIRIS